MEAKSAKPIDKISGWHDPELRAKGVVYENYHALRKLRDVPPLHKYSAFVLALCLMAGCGDSQTKQEAKSGDSAAAQKPAASKPADSAAKPRSAASELGFEHTWKPGAHAAPPVESKPLATPVAARSTTDDDRYADVLPAPAVGARSTGSSRNPELSPPKGRITNAEPPTPALPTGNPLRDNTTPASSGRPQDPPPAESQSSSGDPIPAIPIAPPAVQGSDAKPGSVIQAKPAGTEAGPSLTPETPSGEAKSQPKEHTLDKARPGPRTNKNSGIPFDPITVNGPIFVDLPAKTPWPKPKLALVITGMQAGYLEPCGCAGFDLMKGGMSRRYTLFKMLRDKGWPVVGMDVGGTAKGFGKQAEIKFQIAVNGMNDMRYSSAALGLSDLMLPTEEVLSQTMPANADSKTMFVCGNVGLFAFDEHMLPRTQLIKTGFKTIGVTAILGDTYRQKLAANDNLKMISADKLLNQAVPLLKKQANFMVLLAHATHDEAIELGKKYPAFNLVVCSEVPPAEPPKDAEEINKGGTKLIVVGEKGMYAIVIGLFDDPQQPMRYQRVTLDSRFKSAPEMTALMSAYQDQLKELGLSGLGIRPLPHPLAATNGDYVGSEACQNCHEKSYVIWKKTPHSQAFSVLKNAVPPRNFDPECISCHVVGWNPQKYFPYRSGYLSEKETPKLINVGCEDCHGPGEKHCWAENHGTPADQQAARIAVRLTEEEAADPNCAKQNCWSCHDLDNSPEFAFKLYFPFIKHVEKE